MEQDKQKLNLCFFCPLYFSPSEPFSEKVKAITLPIKAIVPSGTTCQLVKWMWQDHLFFTIVLQRSFYPAARTSHMSGCNNSGSYRLEVLNASRTKYVASRQASTNIQNVQHKMVLVKLEIIKHFPVTSITLKSVCVLLSFG